MGWWTNSEWVSIGGRFCRLPKHWYASHEFFVRAFLPLQWFGEKWKCCNFATVFSRTCSCVCVCVLIMNKFLPDNFWYVKGRAGWKMCCFFSIVFVRWWNQIKNVKGRTWVDGKMSSFGEKKNTSVLKGFKSD